MGPDQRLQQNREGDAFASSSSYQLSLAFLLEPREAPRGWKHPLAPPRLDEIRHGCPRALYIWRCSVLGCWGVFNPGNCASSPNNRSFSASVLSELPSPGRGVQRVSLSVMYPSKRAFVRSCRVARPIFPLALVQSREGF